MTTNRTMQDHRVHQFWKRYRKRLDRRQLKYEMEEAIMDRRAAKEDITAVYVNADVDVLHEIDIVEYPDFVPSAGSTVIVFAKNGEFQGNVTEITSPTSYRVTVTDYIISDH